jgi:hypothetical protein
MMDVWMVGCITYVFGALAEFIVVKYLSWKITQETKASQVMEAEMEAYWNIVKLRGGDEGRSSDTKKGILQKSKGHPYVDFYNSLNPKEIKMISKEEPHDLMFSSLPGAFQHQHEADFIRYTFPTFPRHPWNTGNGNTGDEFVPIGGLPNSIMFPPKDRPIWATIDRVSRAAFPSLFLLFNLAYWPFLVIGSNNQ